MRFWTKKEFLVIWDLYCRQKWYVQGAVCLLVGNTLAQIVRACAWQIGRIFS